MIDRDILRETARATVEAATRAANVTGTTYLGGTVVGYASSSGTPATLGYGSSISVKLDGDDVGVNTPVINVTATNLPIGARVLIADAPTGTFIVGCNNQAGGRYLIQGKRLTASAASIIMNGIPGCFQYLELFYTLRSDAGAAAEALLRVNNISTATYTCEFLAQNAGVSSIGQSVGQTSFNTFCYTPGTNTTAKLFAQGAVRFLDYADNVIRYMSMIGETAIWTAETNSLRMHSGTLVAGLVAPVTRIDLIPGSGNFIAGATVELYGVGVAL